MYAEKIKNVLLNEKICSPVVFRDMISDWPAAKWSPDSLHEELSQQKISFRIGLKQHKGVQWETTCKYEDATMHDFLDWLTGSCNLDNPLSSYHRDTYWCYADYKYMAKMFEARPHLLNAVQWANFGFEGRCGAESTFWLGSDGAYTVCHQDTYGCNLFAQLYGRKRWTLFPPSDGPNLYPTRLPYEESSVFSQVDVKVPDLEEHSQFVRTCPYQVTLEPGNVLFVPRQWWHHVESLETSISVNTWIELDCDNEARLHEAVTRLLACALIPGEENKSVSSAEIPLPSSPQGSVDVSVPPVPPAGGLATNSWLNPTEELTSHRQNIDYIQLSIENLHLHLRERHQKSGPENNPESPSQHADSPDTQNIHHDKAKRQKLQDPGVDGPQSEASATKSMCQRLGFSNDFVEAHVTVLEPVADHFKDLPKVNTDDSSGTRAMAMPTERDIINLILQPDVIDFVCEKIKMKCQIEGL